MLHKTFYEDFEKEIQDKFIGPQVIPDGKKLHSYYNLIPFDIADSKINVNDIKKDTIFKHSNDENKKDNIQLFNIESGRHKTFSFYENYSREVIFQLFEYPLMSFHKFFINLDDYNEPSESKYNIKEKKLIEPVVNEEEKESVVNKEEKESMIKKLMINAIHIQVDSIVKSGYKSDCNGVYSNRLYILGIEAVDNFLKKQIQSDCEDINNNKDEKNSTKEIIKKELSLQINNEINEETFWTSMEKGEQKNEIKENNSDTTLGKKSKNKKYNKKELKEINPFLFRGYKINKVILEYSNHTDNEIIMKKKCKNYQPQIENNKMNGGFDFLIHSLDGVVLQNIITKKDISPFVFFGNLDLNVNKKYDIIGEIKENFKEETRNLNQLNKYINVINKLKTSEKLNKRLTFNPNNNKILLYVFNSNYHIFLKEMLKFEVNRIKFQNMKEYENSENYLAIVNSFSKNICQGNNKLLYNLINSGIPYMIIFLQDYFKLIKIKEMLNKEKDDKISKLEQKIEKVEGKENKRR